MKYESYTKSVDQFFQKNFGKDKGLKISNVVTQIWVYSLVFIILGSLAYIFGFNGDSLNGPSSCPKDLYGISTWGCAGINTAMYYSRLFFIPAIIYVGAGLLFVQNVIKNKK